MVHRHHLPTLPTRNAWQTYPAVYTATPRCAHVHAPHTRTPCCGLPRAHAPAACYRLTPTARHIYYRWVGDNGRYSTTGVAPHPTERWNAAPARCCCCRPPTPQAGRTRVCLTHAHCRRRTLSVIPSYPLFPASHPAWLPTYTTPAHLRTCCRLLPRRVYRPLPVALHLLHYTDFIHRLQRLVSWAVLWW